MPTPNRNSLEGLDARKAALRILDAVLRRGQTMENAAQAAKSLPPADAALASAIAGETLRRLPDLDALIDGATRQKLPDDSKARLVLRLALAQKIGLGTPDHALVATALPLVDGGPRRLVHGVLGTLLRAGIPAIEAPRLPDVVEERWRSAWGDDVVNAARRSIAHRRSLRVIRRWHIARSKAPPPGGSWRDHTIAGLRSGHMVGAGPGSFASRAADPCVREIRPRRLRRTGRKDHAIGRRRA
jgi:NusB family protein